MKRLLFLFFALSLFYCNNSQKNDNGNNNNYYSTKIDSTYSSNDRTKIDERIRFIYEKISDNKYRRKGLELTTKLIDGNASNFTLAKFTYYKDEEPPNDLVSDVLSFENKEELKLLFHKIDSLDAGATLKERKKTLHFEIIKRKSRLFISMYNSSYDSSQDMFLMLKDYEDIKQAFIKFEAE